MSRLGLKPEGARLNYSGQHPWRPSEHEASLSLKGGLCRRAVDGSSSCSWAAKPCKCYEKVRESMSTSVGLRLQEAIPLAFFAHLRPPSQGGFITELNSTGNYSSIRLTRTSTSRPWPEFHFGRQPIPDQRRQTRTIPVDTRGMKAEGITSQPEGRDKTGAGLAVGPESISKACTSALLLNPGLHEAMLVRGQAQLQLGFFAACELDCSDALKAIPNSATAWATRGRARLRQKSYREAADDCRQSLALDAQCRLAMSTLGAALLNLGDNQGALEYCDQAVHAMLDPKGEAEAKAQKKSKKKAGMSRNKDRKKFKERKTVSKIAASSASLATSATTEPEVTGEEMEMIEPGPEESEQRAEVETGQEQEQAPDSPVAESQDGEGGQEGNLLDAETSAVQVEAERDMDRSEIEELADLYTMLAQAKVALGDLDGTIEDCSRALQLNDRVPFCWAARAEAKRLQDKPDDAVADANEALRLDPLNVPAYITRAKAKLKAAHWQFVVTDCSEALALDLHQSSAWSTRAAARLELGDISGSVSDARSAITLDAENVAAWCTLGGALLDNLDIVASAEASSKAIGLDPGCARAWFNRGCARADLQDLEGARKDFDEVVKLWPESFMAFAHRAHIRLKQNDPEGALQDCEQALKLDKRLVRAMCTQAQIKRIMGDLKGAVSDATTALKYDPDCASAFSIRGQAYSKMEKHDKAVQDCQRAIKLDPPTLETPMLAWRHACASDPVPSPMTVWEFQALAAKMKQEAKAQAAAEAAAKWARKAKAAAAKKAEEEALRANMKKNRKSVSYPKMEEYLNQLIDSIYSAILRFIQRLQNPSKAIVFAIELARTELNKSILSDRVLETCELGLSFYAVKSRHGAARNGVRLRGAAAAPVHRVQSLGALPACRWLLGEALQLLGLGTALLQAESRCNGLARRYARGQALPRHVDNPMFEAGVPMMHRIYFDGAVREDTIVGVVLKSGEPCDGLRLCQETPSEGSKALLAEAVGLGLKAGFFAELGFRLEEEDGLCFCLQGPAREMAHEVPAVSSERLSLTFRWFREDFLEELRHMEARLEDDLAS
ncbi:UDP-N-acetylglucosamine--peptide N-acetylglucosaminyltransferase 110 kDa subunit [Symbiodinium microadriaticum]|uniref:UDP-N-acetylglucosamine--peptide N-acetylglucosaminyltransferase 110 kDa subunit n=1 Tax=Symbiodinium microadriaticum TaxID=2951 RepID=A0A1Q9DC91_SYMMI|nr:UDP-N-acetylglucosamine--peptide N-acetylglucosaminyltransferase 110 kDa subunit [Symbiodinium microadriaticum]